MIWSEDSDDSRIRVFPAVVQLTRKAAELDPENPLVWQRLGETQRLAGNSPEAIGSFLRALELMPENGELRLQLAAEYERSGGLESAIDLLDRYLLGRPEDTRARIKRFDLLVEAEKWDIARRHADEIASLAPANAALVSLKTALAWAEGRWSELLSTCDAALAALPGHTGARYGRALALERLGRAEAAASMDLNRFLSVGDLAAPPDFPDRRAFNAALKSEILRNPTLTRDPYGKATRSGFQTEELEQPDSVAVRALLRLIRNAVGQYADRLEAGNDPFTASRPGKARLISWAVVYTDQGKQIPHIHPAGWLSGTYYVAAPVMPEGAREGALLLGAIGNNGQTPPPWGIKNIAAVPGRLVLFPSWVPHGTEATQSAEQRICVAFDVISVNS